MPYFRKFTAVAASFSIAANSAFAWPAQTTTDVNMREGPTTGTAVMTTLPNDTHVEVEECDGAAAWCAVTVDGVTGFVSGKYLTESDSPIGWPRTFDGPNGASITLYQPQVSEWENFTTMKALLAAEIYKTKDSEPLYGVIEISADTFADRAKNEVIATNVVVTDLSFSNLSRDAMNTLALGIGKQLPTEAITLSLARTTASLENFQSLNDLEDLDTQAPLIYVTQTDSILLSTDGDPLTASVENVPDLAFVVNTNWDLFSVYDSGKWILRNGTNWLEAEDLNGPWSALDAFPEELKSLPDNGNWDDARRAVTEGADASAAVPDVFYSDVPAELISTDGPPIKEPVAGTNLEWVSNTEFDLFYHTTENQWYFLTSGRWFRAADMEGEWEFATPDLPADFQKIPDDTPYYTVRSSVPGTPESNEARLLASIPEIAAVEIGSIQGDVTYSGEPEFTQIEGTRMSYALNSSDPVIQVEDKFYTVIDGIWFVGDTAEGPFEVATAVPEDIYTIPATEPVHNVTYVQIYDTTPTTVYTGVSSGYFFGFLAWGAIFYGSGWNYPPYWWGPSYPPPGFRPPYHRPPGYRPPFHRPPHVRPPIGSRPPGFHPRPITYGIGGYYDPKRGQFGRYGKNYGPDRGLATKPKLVNKDGGFDRNPHVTPKARPLGESRDFVSASRPRIDTSNAARAGAAGAIGAAGAGRAFSTWNDKKGVVKGSAAVRSRASNHQAKTGNQNIKWEKGAKDAAANRAKSGDLIAGTGGGVYRQNNGKWEHNSGSGKWEGIQKPAPAPAKPTVNRPAPTTKPTVNRPATAPKTSASRPTQVPSNVGRTHQSRQTGNQRQVQRSAPSRSRGGGGGGRRR